jgi:hypothetical protein
MKRLFSTLTGVVLLASAGGCCCDGCHWGCNPCRPCGGGCAPAYSAPTYSAPVTTGAYVSPAAPVVGLAPATYYGAPVATAALTPVESLPTY